MRHFFYDFQKSSQDRGIGFKCSSCDHCMSSVEVSHRLQEVRVDLKKAVDLMEREKPGGCDIVG